MHLLETYACGLCRPSMAAQGLGQEESLNPDRPELFSLNKTCSIHMAKLLEVLSNDELSTYEVSPTLGNLRCYTKAIY
jgi:hypothetical protein